MSAKNISERLNCDYYEILHFYVDKSGRWQICYDGIPNLAPLCKEEGSLFPSNLIEKLESCDILFPVMHGPYGEDGTIQGFFEILGKAYVGCDLMSSAICMDKAMTKQVCLDHGIETSPFLTLIRDEWDSSHEEFLEEIQRKLSFPLFVKAVHLGSSIGVHKVEAPDQLPLAIQKVFEVDNKIIVEEGVVGRELEFAVFGNSRRRTFHPGEVLTGGKTYDYDAKYGDCSFQITAWADGLSEEQSEQYRKIALKCYRVLGCQGMARIDFFLDREGRLLLNEVNPIPGFTSKSLFPRICEANNLSFGGVLDKFIVLGLHRYRQKQKLKV